ncbi:hypothetical protein FEM48_Zijuj05G0052200 [Ziziphus jujuba var. spinosa]|uniref:Uncharacterized protein n=1 Tax=Ziziphus jujuba var. spinosa TaxID=714518 RepID=A0A978VD07_ZIZJJ|nr:hypothetical protein FEM48_Zijuj05G0052200 [Ziziphus jujuba var. spinosa]
MRQHPSNMLKLIKSEFPSVELLPLEELKIRNKLWLGNVIMLFRFNMCSFLTINLWTEHLCTKVGSLFYAICFLVSFPMFIRIDEKPGDPWDLPRVAIDALGAALLELVKVSGRGRNQALKFLAVDVAVAAVQY